MLPHSITLQSLAAAALPPADDIRRKAAEVIARPEFKLESGNNRDSLPLWLTIVEWLLKPFRWLYNLLEGLPNPLRWLIVIGLTLLLLALCAHLIWSFLTAVRGGPSIRFKRAAPERTTASPEELEAAADRLAAEGDLIGSIRCLFRACLLRLERSEEKPFRRGITNREVLRRYRSSPLFEPLCRMVDLIDTRWYGLDPCLETDLEICRAEHARVRALVERRAHATRP